MTTPPPAREPMTAERRAEINSLVYKILIWPDSAFPDLILEVLAEVDRLTAELDPPVCRLQFPDGTVPANAREAAEVWKRHYDRLLAELSGLREENAKLKAAERRRSEPPPELRRILTEYLDRLRARVGEREERDVHDA